MWKSDIIVFQPSEKVAEDGLAFSSKQRTILTFEIPVHDSERAGLGKEIHRLVLTCFSLFGWMPTPC